MERNTFRFRFWKDRFWVWAVLFPIGLAFWVVPLLFFLNPDNPFGKDSWIFMVFLLPIAYLTGYVFNYSVFEYLYTSVRFVDDEIQYTHPWVIFPALPARHKLKADQIVRVSPMVPHGIGRIAVFLYYRKGGKERTFIVPHFRDIEYLKRIMALVREKPGVELGEPAPVLTDEKKQLLGQRVSQGSFKPGAGDQLAGWLMSLILLGTAIGSAWICMRLPGSKTDSIGFGMTMGFFICATGLIGEFPVLGQAALWLALRPVIRFIFGLFHVDPVSLFWTLPPDLRTLLFDMLGIDLPKINIVDLLFWGAFSLSVVCSLAAIDGWLRRRRLRSGSMD